MKLFLQKTKMILMLLADLIGFFAFFVMLAFLISVGLVWIAAQLGVN